MFDIQEYHELSSIQETKEYLHKNPEATLIAGGTDLLIKLREGKMTDVHYAGISRISELKKIYRNEDGLISIGATVTFKQLENDPVIQEYLPYLGEAGASMGGPQIRTIATIGGNICNGVTSADSASMLCCLNAKLLVESVDNTRTIPINEFYLGPGKVDLKSGELLNNILIDEKDYNGYAGKYIKSAQRKAMDIATLGCSVMAKVSDDMFEDVRIAYGVAAPTPVRCPAAEKVAKGKIVNKDNIEKIAEATMLDVNPRDSWRGSKAFREQLVRENAKRALFEVVKRSGGELVD
jgi:xanthine dehydrogenase FAD-binding subunit